MRLARPAVRGAGYTRPAAVLCYEVIAINMKVLLQFKNALQIMIKSVF